MAGNITDLYVTYGSTLSPSQFHRVVTPQAVGADVNPGGSAPTYLWYKQETVRHAGCVCVWMAHRRRVVFARLPGVCRRQWWSPRKVADQRP